MTQWLERLPAWLSLLDGRCGVSENAFDGRCAVPTKRSASKLLVSHQHSFVPHFLLPRGLGTLTMSGFHFGPPARCLPV
eukprot:805685-Prymnesium_polylepis.1